MYHIASCLLICDYRFRLYQTTSRHCLFDKKFSAFNMRLQHGGIRMVCFGKAFYIRPSPLVNDLGLRQSRWISLGETVQRTAFKMLDATAYPGD